MTTTNTIPEPFNKHRRRLPNVSDAALLLRYRDKGDREAFEELVHRY